jgi:hypothetical protein
MRAALVTRARLTWRTSSLRSFVNGFFISALIAKNLESGPVLMPWSAFSSPYQRPAVQVQSPAAFSFCFQVDFSQRFSHPAVG